MRNVKLIAWCQAMTTVLKRFSELCRFKTSFFNLFIVSCNVSVNNCMSPVLHYSVVSIFPLCDHWNHSGIFFFFFFFFFFEIYRKSLVRSYWPTLASLAITKTRLYNFDPLKPHFHIVKLGCTGVYIIFLISAQRHRLWVLVRTASPRRF